MGNAASSDDALKKKNEALFDAAYLGRHADMVAALEGGAEIDCTPCVSRRAEREAVDRIAISCRASCVARVVSRRRAVVGRARVVVVVVALRSLARSSGDESIVR